MGTRIAEKIYSHNVISGVIGPEQLKTKAVVSLADADATLTASQLIDSGIFTITPTLDRTLTTDTAANIIAALPRYLTGTAFQFVIVNLAAATYTVTLAAGTGVTITGAAVVGPASSGTFIAIVTSATSVDVIRA